MHFCIDIDVQAHPRLHGRHVATAWLTQPGRPNPAPWARGEANNPAEAATLAARTLCAVVFPEPEKETH